MWLTEADLIERGIDGGFNDVVLQMQETVESLYSSRCPRTISAPTHGAAFYEGFEDPNSNGRHH